MCRYIKLLYLNRKEKLFISVHCIPGLNVLYQTFAETSFKKSYVEQVPVFRYTCQYQLILFSPKYFKSTQKVP